MTRAAASLLSPAGALARSSRPVRVMIVDDSITARSVLSRIVEGEDDMIVAATANSAEQALGVLGGEQVDVILLDADGFATPLRSGDDTIVIAANARTRVTFVFAGEVTNARTLRLWGRETPVPTE